MKYCRSRQSALKLKRTHYKTGKPCSRGHISTRFTSTGRCVECDRINKKQRYDSLVQRTPQWADKDEISKIYRQSEELGLEYTVDHIIPLNGELVSGLHVHNNLNITLAKDNFSKQNFYEID